MLYVLAWFGYWDVLHLELEIRTLIGNHACFSCFGNVVSLHARHLECVMCFDGNSEL
jgi:hypothetical protein